MGPADFLAVLGAAVCALGGGGMRVVRGGGISTIIMFIVLFFVLKSCGIDPTGMLTGEGLPGGSLTQEQSAPRTTAQNDKMTQFVKTVLAETEDTWTKIFCSQWRKISGADHGIV